ncbi:MAG: hypothetical protein IPN19_15190 [Elusimicrobia bacterium]|nr:hypothetical protein [Elusimicrobiota bacterium]
MTRQDPVCAFLLCGVLGVPGATSFFSVGLCAKRGFRARAQKYTLRALAAGLTLWRGSINPVPALRLRIDLSVYPRPWWRTTAVTGRTGASKPLEFMAALAWLPMSGIHG